MKRMTCCAYDKDHMDALQIKNTSESDPRSYEVIESVNILKIFRIYFPENILRLQRDLNPDLHCMTSIDLAIGSIAPI